MKKFTIYESTTSQEIVNFLTNDDDMGVDDFLYLLLKANLWLVPIMKKWELFSGGPSMVLVSVSSKVTERQPFERQEDGSTKW